MTEFLHPPTGRWWRFSRYEVRNGSICPSEDSELEWYEPWDAHRKSRSRKGGVAVPWESLVAVIRSAHLKVIRGRLPIAIEEELLAWCGDYGLLGVLPHRTQSVTLAPRWKRSRAVSDRDLFEPVLPNLRQTTTRWIRSTQSKLFGGRAPSEEIGEGELVAQGDRPGDWPEPQALVEDLRGSGWATESLGITWKRFFPAVPDEDAETFEYPIPFSDEFARAYAEPLGDFLDAGGLLVEALVGLGHLKPGAEFSEEDRSAIGNGQVALDRLVAFVRPAIMPLENGSFIQEWVAPSLLASLAMMALLDLTELGRVVACAVCGRMFTSRAYQVLYCSPRCRKTAQMRERRKRKRAGE